MPWDYSAPNRGLPIQRDPNAPNPVMDMLRGLVSGSGRPSTEPDPLTAALQTLITDPTDELVGRVTRPGGTGFVRTADIELPAERPAELPAQALLPAERELEPAPEPEPEPEPVPGKEPARESALEKLSKEEFLEVRNRYRQRVVQEQQELTHDEYLKGLQQEVQQAEFEKTGPWARAKGLWNADPELVRRFQEQAYASSPLPHLEPQNLPRTAGALAGAATGVGIGGMLVPALAAGGAAGVTQAGVSGLQGKSPDEVLAEAAKTGGTEAGLSLIPVALRGAGRVPRLAAGKIAGPVGRSMVARDVLSSADEIARQAGRRGSTVAPLAGTAEDVLGYMRQQGIREPAGAAARVAEIEQLIPTIPKAPAVRGPGGKFVPGVHPRVAALRGEQATARDVGRTLEPSARRLGREARGARTGGRLPGAILGGGMGFGAATNPLLALLLGGGAMAGKYLTRDPLRAGFKLEDMAARLLGGTKLGAPGTQAMGGAVTNEMIADAIRALLSGQQSEEQP